MLTDNSYGPEFYCMAVITYGLFVTQEMLGEVESIAL